MYAVLIVLCHEMVMYDYIGFTTKPMKPVRTRAITWYFWLFIKTRR